MQKAPKRHQLSIKFPKDELQTLQDFIAFAQHFPSYRQTLGYLISLGKASPIVEFQTCQHFNEIPDQPDHILCKNEDGKKTIKRTLTRNYCYSGCSESSIKKVELNQEARKARLDREISTLEEKKKELEPKVTKLTKEFFDLIERIKRAEKIARDENLKQETDDLKAKPKTEIKQKDEEPQVKAEPQEKGELPAMKTSIETERITERVMEKQKIVQEPVLSDLFKGKEILCPMTDKYVSITEQCERKCQTYPVCELYPSINEGKIPEGAKIR